MHLTCDVDYLYFLGLVPQKPTDIVFSSKTTSSVTVSWSYNSAATKVTGWRIRYTPKVTNTWSDKYPSNPSADLANLTPGQTYTVQVYSRSGRAESLQSLQGEVIISEYALKYINTNNSLSRFKQHLLRKANNRCREKLSSVSTHSNT